MLIPSCWIRSTRWGRLNVKQSPLQVRQNFAYVASVDFRAIITSLFHQLSRSFSAETKEQKRLWICDSPKKWENISPKRGQRLQEVNSIGLKNLRQVFGQAVGQKHGQTFWDGSIAMQAVHKYISSSILQLGHKFNSIELTSRRTWQGDWFDIGRGTNGQSGDKPWARVCCATEGGEVEGGGYKCRSHRGPVRSRRPPSPPPQTCSTCPVPSYHPYPVRITSQR